MSRHAAVIINLSLFLSFIRSSPSSSSHPATRSNNKPEATSSHVTIIRVDAQYHRDVRGDNFRCVQHPPYHPPLCLRGVSSIPLFFHFRSVYARHIRAKERRSPPRFNLTSRSRVARYGLPRSRRARNFNPAAVCRLDPDCPRASTSSLLLVVVVVVVVT